MARADMPGLLQALSLGGARLLWLVPYRTLFFICYALGWLMLLRSSAPGVPVSLAFVFWVTTVREAVDRLLPVASVGGGVVGVRLLRWRNVGTAPAAATVIVEIILTLLALWVFLLVALALLEFSEPAGVHTLSRLHLSWVAAGGLAVPVVLTVWLRHGRLFARLAAPLRKFTGMQSLSASASALDEELRACFGRGRQLATVTALQLLALFSGSFEIWFVLRLLGQPVDVSAAVIMEALSQSVRQAAFIIPGGLGVQEASLILLGQLFGVSAEMALAVSLAKRLREVLCGLPALLSWQWCEMQRLRAGGAKSVP